MTGRICGTGSFIPEYCMDNEELSGMVDTSDAWIRERTGIVRRHIARAETVAFMAAEAGKRALENAAVEVAKLELIIVATFSAEAVLPSVACEVQKEIGAKKAVCFDINAACTGFLFAYQTAQAYIAAGIYRKILLIGAEKLSSRVDWTDRGTCILFGDGAGAVVLKAGEGELLPMCAYSDGESSKALTCREPELTIKMDGRRVFEFAVRRVPEAIAEVLEKSQLKKEDIRFFLLHQANERIVAAVAKRLSVEAERFPMNLSEYGNTSAASIPILLDELNRSGRLRRGNHLILAGFGAGLSWGASLIKW